MSKKPFDPDAFISERTRLIELSAATDTIVAGTVGAIVLRLLKQGEDISSERLMLELRKAAEGPATDPDVIRAKAALTHLNP